jgi:hypothetical protein
MASGVMDAKKAPGNKKPATRYDSLVSGLQKSDL